MFKIEISLDKDFENLLTKFKYEYSEELFDINGLSSRYMNYNNFIDNFIDTSTIADSSVDSSSNVAHKDMPTLMSEMSKPHKKLLSYNKIYYEIKKRFGKENADKWFTYEFDGHLYLHDAASASFVSYCFSYDLKELAEKGLFFLNDGSFNSEPPQHLETFIDFVKEFTSYASNRTSGAVGLSNLIIYMYYFWKKDINSGYIEYDKYRFAKQQFQRLIYALNQPYVRDGIQSAFTNTSIFDHEYFEALFGASTFPDGSYMIDYEEEIIEFQKIFLEVFSGIRSKNMMTFPVNTISLLFKNGKFVDEEFARYAIEHNRQWNDSNLFISESVTSLSNCCFSGKQAGIIKVNDEVYCLPFKELYEKYAAQSIETIYNGKWIKCNLIKTPAKQLYKIKTVNNKELLATEDHIHVTLNGNKTSTELTKNDYLKLNISQLKETEEVENEREKKLTYADGFILGLYLCHGEISDIGNNIIGTDNNNSDNNSDKESPIIDKYTSQIELYLSKEAYYENKNVIQQFVDDKYPDAEIVFDTENEVFTNIYSLLIKNVDSEINDFIKEFIKNENDNLNKELNLNCLLYNTDFRKGILEGYNAVNYHNFTISENIKNSFEALIISLGMQSIIIDEKQNDLNYNYDHPIYQIKSLDNASTVDQYDCILKNDSLYVKIDSIEKYEEKEEEENLIGIETQKYAYCFRINSGDEPYFVLSNGIITHNCRLVSNIEKILDEKKNIGRELGFQFSIGGTALSVGSVKCSTINFARIAIESDNEEEYLEKLRDIVKTNLMALDRVRHIITRNVEKGILHNFSYNLIDFEHLYNTIGFTGCWECLHRFGYTYKDEFDNTFYSKDALRFGAKIFDSIREVIEEFKKENDITYMINIEQTPGESACSKLMEKDKYFYKDKVIDILPLYGNQFIPLGIKTTLQERIRIASAFDKFCNGGSILHINIDAPFDSFSKAWDMVNYIANKGVTYFAFNTKIQVCKHNHAFYGKICPECGEPVDGEYTRIVGFLTKTQYWSDTRKQEYKLREWEPINLTSSDMFEKE